MIRRSIAVALAVMAAGCAGSASPPHTAPVRSLNGIVTEFSTGLSSVARPMGIASGPDGNVWFTEDQIHRIGRITPAGAITEFSTGMSQAAQPNGIAAGPDGNMWFAELNGSRIGRITPAGVITEFSNGMTPFCASQVGCGARPFAIAAGADGNMWFTEVSANRIGRITMSGVITEFSTGVAAEASPTGIARGPDGNMWFTEYVTRRIGRITPNGTVTEFSDGISRTGFPTDIVAGPDGNLWFTEASSDSAIGGKIGRITPTGVVTEFSSGLTSGPLRDAISGNLFPADPNHITVGPDGNLWFTERSNNRIGRITSTGAITEFSVATTLLAPFPEGITTGPDGNLWFAEPVTGRIGRFQ